MAHLEPLAIELFCGSFGWSAGWLELGGRAIGFDIDHQPHHGPVPDGAELVLQDVLTLRGDQFKNASLILASPPCTEFSYLAMPWTRGKRIAAALRGKGEFPDGYTGSRTVADMCALFTACFRIQREACEAAGRHIPMVVENVKGAQPWVGPAKAHYGSFYLWGDVDMVGDRIIAGGLRFGDSVRAAKRGSKNTGGSWFAIANNTTSGHKQNPDGRQIPQIDHNVMPFYVACESDGRKVPSMTGWDGYGKPGYKPMGFNVEAAKRFREEHGGTKGTGGSWFTPTEDGRTVQGHWRDSGCETRKFNSKSDSRKAASAQIAKIPLPLASYIARAYKPVTV